MTTSVDTLPAEMSVEDAIPTVRTSDHGGFPVVDSNGEPVGIVTLTDLEPFVAGRAEGETDRRRNKPSATSARRTSTP